MGDTLKDVLKFSEYLMNRECERKLDTRYFLDRDDDCHWYLVDAEKRNEWNTFLSGDKEECPYFAKMLNYNIHYLEFSNPILKNF